jgi:hypothetical protein
VDFDAAAKPTRSLMGLSIRPDAVTVMQRHLPIEVDNARQKGYEVLLLLLVHPLLRAGEADVGCHLAPLSSYR